MNVHRLSDGAVFPRGQILLVTGRRGWFQQEGKEARELHPGDVVRIPANVRHWHGAAKDSWFSHLSIETNCHAGPVEWMDLYPIRTMTN
jgi:quercetin dioxygenase-like cupin family protein